MKIRAGLLILLPLFVLAIYLEGQRYAPALLNFSKTPGTDLTAFLPASIGGLVRDVQVRLFTRDNLFEHVDGHAELFISQGFVALAVAGYKAEKDKAGMPAYLAEIYHMGTPENAFGVMSEESLEAEPEDIGFMGFRTDKTVMFIQGPYYAKIASFSSGAESLTIAAQLIRKMGDLKTVLPQFARFPEKGALPEGRSFIRSDYMGLDFISHVFEQRYQRGEAAFYAFLVEPQEGVQKFVADMLSFYKGLGTEVVPFEVGGARAWEIRDKYEGTWSLVMSGVSLVGVREMKDGEARNGFLTEVVEKGKKK